MVRRSSAPRTLIAGFILFLGYCGYFIWELAFRTPENDLLLADFTVLLYILMACCMLSIVTLACWNLLFQIFDTTPLIAVCNLMDRIKRIRTYVRGIQK